MLTFWTTPHKFRPLFVFLVPVRASPVPSVVRGSFVVKFLDSVLYLGRSSHGNRRAGCVLSELDLRSQRRRVVSGARQRYIAPPLFVRLRARVARPCPHPFVRVLKFTLPLPYLKRVPPLRRPSPPAAGSGQAGSCVGAAPFPGRGSKCGIASASRSEMGTASRQRAPLAPPLPSPQPRGVSDRSSGCVCPAGSRQLLRKRRASNLG